MQPVGADKLDFFKHLTNGIKTLKEQGKREKRDPFHAGSHKVEDGSRRPPFGGTIDDVRDDVRRIKEMGVDHVILQLTDPDLNLVIDTAKQGVQIRQITYYALKNNAYKKC